jgi:uncharacterized membrane-anchored protein YhcB (DUF1043 family)
MDLNEKLETLVTQYEQVSRQAADAVSLKTKLEGAIEFTQALVAEEKESADNKTPKKEVAKK